MGNVFNPYPSQIRNLQILTADTVLGLAGVWAQIGAGYVVPDGQAIRLGHGSLAGQDNAQGRLYFDMVDDAAGPEDGMVRIVARNPSLTRAIILFQGSTNKGRAGAADDRYAQIPFPAIGDFIPENWVIAVEILPDLAADTVDVSACFFYMDIEAAEYRA